MQFPQITRNAAYLVTGGLLVGGGLGYLVAAKTLEKRYRQLAEDEIASVKKYYAIIRKEGVYSDPANLVEAILDNEPSEEEQYETQVQTLEYATNNLEVTQEIVDTPEGRSEEVTIVRSNVFSEMDDEEGVPWDLGLPDRTNEAPYVIAVDEFMNSELEGTTLTFYEDDEILADEQDQPLPNSNELVGDENLQFFGRGSADNNVLYVHNPRLGNNFEVIRVDGSYAETVFGIDRRFPDENPRRRSPGKMRDDD